MRRAWNRRARADAGRFIAGPHAETEERFWKSGTRDLAELVLRDLRLSPKTRALEIGCGVGRLLRPLTSRVERAWGVDISEEMIRRARTALGDLENVQVRLTDGSLDGFGDATLDLVFSFIVFQHIPQKRDVFTYVREAARVLEAGGVLRFQVDGRAPHRWWPRDTWRGVSFAKPELLEELAAAGFEDVDVWGEGTQYLWATATRLGEPGQPRSSSVRRLRRTWNHEAVEALLHRLGADCPGAVELVLLGECTLRALAVPFLERGLDLPAEDFVRVLYRAVLGREADAEGLAFHTRGTETGVARAYVLDCLLSSPELEDRLRPLVEAEPPS
jgi:ubiquinone/menaquinone biosynthesis C-methylase UbiE